MSLEQNTTTDADATLALDIEHWYSANARDLPWRRERTPWRALVSELMLQQTQVSRVAERFEPFMARFPDPAALARADEQDVLAMWQGLGYYRRARNLHAAAKVIVEQFDGHTPADAASLRTLPGVGRYTAGSIASIVGGHHEAIVDGNVARVLARLHADDGDTTDTAFQKRAWARAGSLVSACDDPALLNEGLMELGATVCMPPPHEPRCDACPVRADCRALATGRTGDIPRPRKRAVQTSLHQHAVVIRRRGRVLVEQRAGSGLWAGLWQVPTLEGPGQEDRPDLARALGLELESVVESGAFKRALTHRVVHVRVYEGHLKPGARVDMGQGRRWVTRSELESLPLSSAARAVLD